MDSNLPDNLSRDPGNDGTEEGDGIDCFTCGRTNFLSGINPCDICEEPVCRDCESEHDAEHFDFMLHRDPDEILEGALVHVVERDRGNLPTAAWLDAFDALAHARAQVFEAQERRS